MDMSRLDFSPASFDVIVSVDTFYFTDLVETLAGCRSLLREGGQRSRSGEVDGAREQQREPAGRPQVLPAQRDAAADGGAHGDAQQVGDQHEGKGGRRAGPGEAVEPHPEHFLAEREGADEEGQQVGRESHVARLASQAEAPTAKLIAAASRTSWFRSSQLSRKKPAAAAPIAAPAVFAT